jgi:hypothetical protein
MARKLGLPEPQFLDSAPGEGKVVDGNRICHELGFEYEYPNPMTMPLD